MGSYQWKYDTIGKDEVFHVRRIQWLSSCNMMSLEGKKFAGLIMDRFRICKTNYNELHSLAPMHVPYPHL